jgi:hypothetical protein
MIVRLSSVPFGELLAVPTLLILTLAALYAVGDAFISEAPSPREPGLADSVLASRAVIAAIRIALIAAAGYVVVSVVALVSRRQWLVRVGPVEVSEQVSDINAENAMLKEMLKSERAETRSLRSKLEAADVMLTTNVHRSRGGRHG